MDTLLLMKHELLLALMLAVILISRISGEADNSRTIFLFNSLMIVNCIAGWIGNSNGTAFGSMFVNSGLLAFEKNILNAGTLLICLSSTSWLSKQKHLSEFYLLLISALLGMFFMLSSSNLLMFYLSIELTAIPSAALCNFNVDERRSSEAAMKMIFSSAFSSCLMLLGISFWYGATGSLNYSGIAPAVISPLLATGFFLFLTGIIFKLSVVPFHLWTADVYEGSPVIMTSFLSVISKGAMVFVLYQFLFSVFTKSVIEFHPLLLVLSTLTILTGNIFAIRQENLKRFLAFSSISQVGFILLAMCGESHSAYASSVYFIIIYILSNVAGFAVISQISEKTGKESIDDYKGLAKTNPVMSWSMAIALFSLAGIPPTAGFFGKFFLITAGAGSGNYGVITFAALNMIISLYYYLRVIRAMFMDQGESISIIKTGNSYRVTMFVCLSGLLLTGFFGAIYDYIYSLASKF
jgi:NADH-quinone oxidoreductase subunit N